MSGRRKKSKKPSGTRAEQLLEQSTFFRDECLGRQVPESLRSQGWKVEPWYAHFERGTDDAVWLPIVGGRGWVVLTKDKAIRRKPWEMDKVMSACVRMFTLPTGSMSGADMLAVFLANGRRMGRVLHKQQGPFIAVVSRTEVVVVREAGFAAEGGTDPKS